MYTGIYNGVVYEVGVKLKKILEFDKFNKNK